jgi:hypothetical protein
MRQLQQGFAAHETVVRDQVAAFLRRGCRLWVKPGLQPMSALRPLIGPKQPKMVRVEAFRLSTVSTGIAARVDRNGSHTQPRSAKKTPHSHFANSR